MKSALLLLLVTASLGASGVYYDMRTLDEGRIYLLLVNHGPGPVSPETLGSRLYVDGKLLTGAAVSVLLNPPDPKWTSLEPGRHVLFGATLSTVLDKPGLHTLVWKGKGFTSNEVRVLVAP